MTKNENKEAALASMKKQREAKAMQVLLGICAGITADDHVNDTEIHFLSTWLTEYDYVASTWPGSVIAARVKSILQDGTITEDERTGLLAMLNGICGGSFTESGSAAPEVINLPYDDTPTITFSDSLFCFTGTFSHGSRKKCESSTIAKGGKVIDRMTTAVDYLVIAASVGPDWINSSYGRKIESAIELRQKQGRPLIISEQKWTNHLNSQS